VRKNEIRKAGANASALYVSFNLSANLPNLIRGYCVSRFSAILRFDYRETFEIKNGGFK